MEGTLKQLFEEYKKDAKEMYLLHKKLFENLEGKIDPTLIKIYKNLCIMNAGIYNKDKHLYVKGYNKVISLMLELIENFNEENSSKVCLDFCDDLPKTHYNEGAYLRICNNFKEEKKLLDERNNNLMRFGYFDSSL